ncbi:MAG: hypothetical protein RLZZ141_2175 [Pseudomonadota bacterium]
MSIFRAYTQFNINNVNFNWYYANYSRGDVYKNQNVIYNGTSYVDLIWINGVSGYSNFELDYVGSGIKFNIVNGSKVITAGTINAFREWNVSSNTVSYIIEGVSIDAALFYNAAQTASNADELSLIERALLGNDNFYGSTYSDVMNG